MRAPNPFQHADRMVDEHCAMDPIAATMVGVPGHDHLWPDLSPAGIERARHFATTHLAALTPFLSDNDPIQNHAAGVIAERLREDLDEIESGDIYYDVSHIGCSFEAIRSVFDVMETSSEEGLDAVCTRLETIDQVFHSYESRLLMGVEKGHVASERQVATVLRQADDLAGPQSAFDLLVDRCDRPTERLSPAAAGAKRRIAEFSDFLRKTYGPASTSLDTTDRDRYERSADRLIGLTVDIEEAYEWGWAEIWSILGEMQSVADDILPGAPMAEVVELLESDPARSSANAEDLVRFVEKRQNQALEQLDGSHFAVPAAARMVSVNLAPAGGPPGAYYLPPSEDFSRPGSIWYSIIDGQAPVPLYQEVSTAYHEGFPGHHLQLATSLANADQLSRYHRVLIWYSGFGEGWALYAERLMAELGYFEKPDYLYGMLASGLFRAARVVVDIGCHLGLRIPSDAPLHGGGTWTFETAVDFMHRIGLQAPHYAESEVVRYLGLPGQAISYKLGERQLLEMRARFSPQTTDELRAFHSRALGFGDVRLDRLQALMAAVS